MLAIMGKKKVFAEKYTRINAEIIEILRKVKNRWKKTKNWTERESGRNNECKSYLEI